MEWIINEGRVGKADPAFPWPNMRDYLIDDDGMERYQIALESCLSHATWFVESENERAVDELRDGSPECKYQSWRPKNGPYSVENFPKTEVVRQWATSIDSPLWYDSFGDMKVDAVYRTVLRFKQEPNKIEVVADFGKEWYLKGLKDGMESIKQEPKEEPKTGESQAEIRDALIDFVNWFSKLQPSDKCTIHPPAGSGGSTGIYDLTNAAIVDKFLTRKQTEQ